MNLFRSFRTSPKNSSEDSEKDMDSKHKGRKPKLERRNALKNIEYDASPSASPSSKGDPLSRSSISLNASSPRTSFRIDGDSELTLLYERLGVSGPEEFGIPVDAWEARKQKSPSDLTPTPRFYESEPSKIDIPSDEENEGLITRLEDMVNISKGDEKASDIPNSDSSPVVKPACLGNATGGIKGTRPSSLSQPSPDLIPALHGKGSTWHTLNTYAPEESEHEESDEENDEPVRTAMEQEENGDHILPDTTYNVSSFSTINDDDNSSTTTEGMLNISPTGRNKRPIQGWEKGKLLGKGSFGTVYEGISSDGFFFAVKEVSLFDQDKGEVDQLEQEIVLLSQFEHENIVQYLGSERTDSHLFIFLELVTQGSLASLYKAYKLRSQASSYTRQILNGLKYLHDRKVIHRDIKCANILVDASGSIKLADFGLAKKTINLTLHKSCKGSAYWMAPEVVKVEPYGVEVDIWSLGCTVLEMLTHQVPYPNLEWQQALLKIGRGQPPPIPDYLSQDARDFIHKCLQVKPEDRPSASDLLSHPFVRRTPCT